MATSPEHCNHSSPCSSPRVLGAEHLDFSCRTPNGATISYLAEPATCPPAPRKPRAPPACKKRLIEAAEVLSFRLGELERLFRPCPPPACKKRLIEEAVEGRPGH